MGNEMIEQIKDVVTYGDPAMIYTFTGRVERYIDVRNDRMTLCIPVYKREDGLLCIDMSQMWREPRAQVSS